VDLKLRRVKKYIEEQEKVVAEVRMKTIESSFLEESVPERSESKTITDCRRGTTRDRK